MRWAIAGVLRGFASFVEGARLAWALRGLRRLALASTLVTLYFLATVLLLLEGFERGRLVALGEGAPKGWSTALTVWSMFALLFTFPVLGPISSALQAVAAERTRAAFAGLLLPAAGLGAWFGAVLGELARFHRRLLQLSLGALLTVLAVMVIVPEGMPRTQVAFLFSSALFVLDSLLRGLSGAVPRAELLRRWPELVGFVFGSWCLTLFGLGPWFVILNAVGAEVFRARLRDPKATVNVNRLRELDPNASDDPHAETAAHGPIPSHVADRIRRRYARAERNLSWDAEPPKTVRYEYLSLRSDPRPGEYQIGALLPTNEDDTLNLTEPIRFWVVATDRAPNDGRYRRFIDDRFAGPLDA